MAATVPYEYEYGHYGLRVCSDMALPELLPLEGSHEGAVFVHRGDVSASAPQHGAFLRADKDVLNLNVDGIVRFAAKAGRELIYEPAPHMDEDSVRLFLFGSGMAALLMQRGILVLHGNAIETAKGCVVCLGPSGTGKSTVAAGMLHRGYRVITDDVCPIDDENRVIPGMPRVKLWQESADFFGIETDALAPIRPGLAKFSVQLNEMFCPDRRPLKAIICLQTDKIDQVYVDEISGAEKFETLRQQTFRPHFVGGLNLEEAQFRQIARLAPDVTMFNLARPEHGDHTTAVLDAIEDLCGTQPMHL